MGQAVVAQPTTEHVEDPQDVGMLEQPLLSAVPPDLGMLEQPLLSAVPPSAPPQMIKFTLSLPTGAVRGQQIQFVAPNGTPMTLAAPHDVGCGGTIEVDIPTSPAQIMHAERPKDWNPFPSQPPAQIMHAERPTDWNPFPSSGMQQPFNPGEAMQPPFNPGQAPQSNYPFFDMSTEQSAAFNSWILFVVGVFVWWFGLWFLAWFLWISTYALYMRLPVEVRYTRAKQKQLAYCSAAMCVVSFIFH